MNRSNAHSAWLRGRLRGWLIGATVVALAAWLFEFSTHLHVADADDAGAPSAAHPCGYCAAMQVGAGPASTVVLIPPSSPDRVESATDEAFSSSSARASYRSRAPPAV